MLHPSEAHPSAVRLPPWWRPDAFPRPLPGSQHGYLRRGRPAACSLQDLQTLCRRSPPLLVWTPETNGLEPPAAVPQLEPLVAAHRAEQPGPREPSISWRLAQVIIAVVLLAAWGVPVWLAFVLTMTASGIVIWLSLRSERVVFGPPPERSWERFVAWFRLRPHRAAWLILACSLVCWVMRQSVGNAAVVRANHPGLTLAAPWQWLAGVWLDGGARSNLVPLLVLALWVAGVEALAGSAWTLGTFFASGFFGAMACSLVGTGAPIGAHGGAWGVAGFGLVLAYRHALVRSARMPPTLLSALVLVLLAWTWLGGRAAACAGLGGLATGLVLGSVRGFGQLPFEPSLPTRVVGTACALALVAAAAWCVLLVLR